jgi:hypothetical protein
MAKANANTATVATATVAATVTALGRKAQQVANAAGTKYERNPRAVPNANVLYALTPLGIAIAANGGLGKQGKATCMGQVAVAAASVAAKGRPLTGLNIVAAMQSLPVVKAAIAASKASSGYAANNATPEAHSAGYVQGAARQGAGLLTIVSKG